MVEQSGLGRSEQGQPFDGQLGVGRGQIDFGSLEEQLTPLVDAPVRRKRIKAVNDGAGSKPFKSKRRFPSRGEALPVL